MDITKFCGHHDPRTYLRKPMRHDGFLYATNSHIAVRIADDPAIEANPMPQNLQNGVLQKMATDTTERTWIPVPKIDTSSMRDCRTCSGTGRVVSCPACDGDGEFEHYSDMYDCKNCDGHGHLPAEHESDGDVCGDCSGTGIDCNHSVEIGGCHIAVRYLRLIGTEIPDAALGISRDPAGFQLFRAPGVIGVVMPMQP